MKFHPRRLSLVARCIPFATAVSTMLSMHAAWAEEATPIEPPGISLGADWTLNLDAAWGFFGFGDSLYTNPKPDDISGDLSDNWVEGSLKAGITGVHELKNSSQVYGKLSAAGERTHSNAPSLVGGDESSFDAEDIYIGWRSGNSLPTLGENALDFTLGRAPYKIGHGMLLSDGGAEGGSRGGYWTNVRKAWQFAGVGRLKTHGNTFEVFYLEKNELPEANKKNKVAGLNYEYAIGETTTLGGTYMKWSADPALAPQRDGLDVYDVRVFTAPFTPLPGLSFEVEYAREENGEALDSDAWNALVAYKFDAGWKPKLSYRYAAFEGDDVTTAKNEGFDPLATGFYDWGTWWQGEIAGEYFLSNSNLISHQVRLHMTPLESLGTGLIFYDFLINKPAAFGPQVTSDQAAYEIDWYTDWSVNKNFTISVVAAAAEPNKAIEQITGRTDTFLYGMLYLAYSF